MFTPFYERWWKEFGLAPLKESKANCASCTMVSPPQNETPRDAGPFRAELKCCTYFPFIPNFTIGSLLSADERVMGRAFESGLRSPLGLFSPREQTSSRSGFGKDESQLCPFNGVTALGGSSSCTIWESRPAVCASYFCISSTGVRGQGYWSTAEEFGNLLEWTLVHESLWRLGFTQHETSAMASAVESRDPEQVAKSWLEWRGRETELYGRCFEISREVDPQELRSLMGDEGDSLINHLKDVRSTHV